MEFLLNLFNTLLYRPLFNLLVLFYEYLPGQDLGVAIIVLTLFIKFLLFPLNTKAIKIQRTLQDIQPKVKELQDKFKDNKEKLAIETLNLYKQEKINPFAGLFISLAQVPVLIALYLVFAGGFGVEKMVNLYDFVSIPSVINTHFFSILNLGEPSLHLAFLAGISQFFQAKTIMSSSSKKSPIKQKDGMPDISKIMEKQALYFFPVITVIFLLKLPSAIALYWLSTALFSAVQQKLILAKN